MRVQTVALARLAGIEYEAPAPLTPSDWLEDVLLECVDERIELEDMLNDMKHQAAR